MAAMTRPILAAFILLLLAGPALAGDLSRTQPHPSLSPKEVVVIVMRALRHNDTGGRDRGIDVTFNFASPANKRTTGPLSRFKAMVKGPVYGPMIGHQSVVFENYKIEGSRARIDAVLVSTSGKSLGFRFGLSRQRVKPFAGNWMTDSVVPIEVVTL
jgi:hypothetical protein